MDSLSIKPHDEVFVRIVCEPSISQELREHFSFRPPNYRYHPSYKAGYWDGYIYLFNPRSGLLYKGLIERVKDFCKSRQYQCEVEASLEVRGNVPLDVATQFFNDLNTGHEPRDYQIETLHHAINHNRAVFLSATASGKSLSIYAIYRWHKKKTLLVVPTINLLNQMGKDFVKYGYDGGKIHSIKSGVTKDSDCPLIISTYQSIEKMPKAWFNQFEMVIVDEVHQAKATSFKKIMENLDKCKLRYGFTGTLDGSKTSEVVITGLFGPVKEIIDTKEMQDKGYASKSNIEVLVLEYKDELRKLTNKFTYPQETAFLLQYKRRLKFISKLANSLDGVTLVLFNQVDTYGKPLFEDIKENARYPVYYVTGGVKGDVREEIRQIVLKDKNAVIAASYGVFSTGVNVPNINNIIFATPTKSRVRLLQSIGRGLRLHENKSECTIYDIADDLSWKKHTNYGMKHLRERLKIYISESFKYKITKLEI